MVKLLGNTTPVYEIDSLKDVTLRLDIICPPELFQRLEWAAKVIGFLSQLTGIKVSLTVSLIPPQ